MTILCGAARRHVRHMMNWPAHLGGMNIGRARAQTRRGCARDGRSRLEGGGLIVDVVYCISPPPPETIDKVAFGVDLGLKKYRPDLDVVSVRGSFHKKKR
jgi:hypothetical protein